MHCIVRHESKYHLIGAMIVTRSLHSFYEYISCNKLFKLFDFGTINKDLYSRKDMNLGRFNIDCMYVCCVARLPLV